MAYMTCTAAGDAMVFRRLPGAYPGFEALRKFISRGDFRFFNLETTVHNFESYGAASAVEAGSAPNRRSWRMLRNLDSIF